MRWCIFYGDGSTFSHDDGDHKDAPAFGVQVIVQDWRHPLRCQVFSKSDFYWWRDDHWCAGDIFGFLDQSARYGASWVKQGETIYHQERDVHSEIIARAVELSKEWDK